MSDEKMKNDHSGHRKRMLSRLEEGLLCEHEYLEILLFNALPRRNTNDAAHRLIAKFGSMRAVLRADYDELLKVDGIGENVAAYLSCIGKILDEAPLHRSRLFPKKYEAHSFCSFVRSAYADMAYEVLEVYLIDGDGGVYKRRNFSTEEIFRVCFDAETMFRFITEEKPSGVVLVHNHPQGDMYPSKMDDFTTYRIRSITRNLNVVFCDHIIYSPKGVFSYALTGRLHNLPEITLEEVIKHND